MYLLAVLRSLTILANLKLSLAQLLLGLQWSDNVSEYTAQMQVGTPGQDMTMRIEFETFFTNYTLIQSTNSTNCARTADLDSGCQFGSFDRDLSSSYHANSQSSDYVNPSAGLKFIDKLGFDGMDGVNYSMLLSYDLAMVESNTPAVDDLEPSLPFLYLLGDFYNPRENILDHMVSQEYIPTPAFSLWLQDGNEFAGGLLFGAIDKNRYEGDLISLDTYGRYSLEVQAAVAPASGGLASVGPVIAIAMTSLSMNSPTGKDEIWIQGPLLVRIKLGDDLWLSPYLAAQIRNITGAFVRSDETGTHEYTVIPCKMQHSAGYLTFGFGGPDAFKVNVSMASLVTPPPKRLRQLFTSFGEDMCRFGISETKGYDVGFLSSHFLRSVYTVVDLYNNKVAMAPINPSYAANRPNTVRFEKLGAPIPSAISAVGQPPAVSTIVLLEPPAPSSFQSAEGFRFLTTETAPSPPPSNHKSYSRGDDFGIGTNIGIIVSVAAIFLLILVLVIWRRWKRHHDLETSFTEQVYTGMQRDLEDGIRIQRIHEIDGTSRPAELSGVKEPSELHGKEIRAELPGDHQFPGRTKAEATEEKQLIRQAAIKKAITI